MLLRFTAAVAALTLSPALAIAQGVTILSAPLPSRVRIEAPSCTVGPFDPRAWLPLVRNEIETDGIQVVDSAPSAAGEDPSLAVIHVEPRGCREDATEVAVTIDDLLTRKTVRRVVALDDIAAAGRPRALALAIAELLRASWAEIAMRDAPVAEAAVPPAVRRAVVLRLQPSMTAMGSSSTSAAPSANGEGARTPGLVTGPWWLGATLEARTFPGQSGALVGGRAIATWSPWRRVPLRFRLDAGGAAGSALARRGEVLLRMASAGLSALIGAGVDRFDIAIGARVEGGWAWVEGIPSNAAEPARGDDDVIAVVSAVATLRVALFTRWSAVIDVAVGQTVSSITVLAEGASVAGLRGPSLAVGVGLGASLP